MRRANNAYIPVNVMFSLAAQCQSRRGEHEPQHPADREVGIVRSQFYIQHIYKQRQFASISLAGESVVGTSNCIDYEFVIACSEKYPGGCSSAGLWL